MTGKPSIVSYSDGFSSLFFRGTDNHVYQLSSTSTSAWTPTTGPSRVVLPGETDIICASDITVHGSTSSEVNIFVRSADNIVYHKMYQRRAGGWTHWAALRGVRALSDIAVAGWGTDMWVAVRTINNLVAFKERKDYAWSEWDTEHIGGQILGSPTIFRQTDQTSLRLHLFMRGLENKIYAKSYAGGVWQRDWTSLAGTAVSNPVVAPAADKWGVFIVGTDNHVHYKWWDGSAWKPSEAGAWDDIGGAVASPTDPTVVVRNDGTPQNPFWREEVFVQWTDNSVHQQSWNLVEGWKGWTSLGGVIDEGLAVAKAHVHEPRVVVKGADGMLWERRA